MGYWKQNMSQKMCSKRHETTIKEEIKKSQCSMHCSYVNVDKPSP